jgi:diaminopimelate epimerase
MRLAFTKMQGVGNDFVVVDGRERAELDWAALAIRLCDRHKGVGADGLLALDSSDRADLLMRMFNPDGTPDVCGNGLRCIARYAIERGVVSDDRLRIETFLDVREAVANRTPSGHVESVTVNMGPPRFAPSEVPVVAEQPVRKEALTLPDGETLTITALSTGSTHAVTFVSELPDDTRFFAISPQVEHHARFPERTSLMWCQVESPSRLRLRIWERGAGETWGCGTGACAAAVAAILEERVVAETPITVASRGGELVIAWQPGAEIAMTGPAEFVYEGVLS